MWGGRKTHQGTGSRFAILALLFQVAYAQEDLNQWRVFTGEVQLFSSYADQFLIVDSENATMTVFETNAVREVGLSPDQRQDLEYAALDDQGGLWLFGDPISSKQTGWFAADGAFVGEKDLPGSTYDDHKQSLRAFAAAYERYGHPFQLGKPSDPYVPAFGPNGEIAVLNDRRRLCISYSPVAGSVYEFASITGKEFPDDRVLGHPRFDPKGNVLLDGEKGTYRLSQLKGEHDWVLIEPVSAFRKPKGRRFPRPEIISFPVWQGEFEDVAWSGSGFEVLLSIGDQRRVLVLGDKHPLMNFEGKVRLGADRAGRWWFEGAIRRGDGEQQIVVYTPKLGQVNPPVSKLVQLSAGTSIAEQFEWKDAVPKALDLLVNIGDDGWMKLTGLPLLKQGIYPLEVRLLSVKPPLVREFSGLLLSFEVDIDRDVQDLLSQLGDADFQNRLQAEVRLERMLNLEFVRELLRERIEDSRDPELVFRCTRLLALPQGAF